MIRIWKKIEAIIEHSHLRLPIYIFTVISGIGFYMAPNIFIPTVFVSFLGLLTLLETIHPTGYNLLFTALIPTFLSNKIQITILIVLKTLGIVLGIFLMFIGIGVEIGRHLD
jgi:hypothetical protein